MPTNTITFEEAWDGREWDKDTQNNENSSLSVKYIVQGAATEADAIAALLNASQTVPPTIPTSVDGVPLLNINVLERLSTTAWKLSIRYAKGNASSWQSSSDVDDTLTFDTTVQPAKVVTPIATVYASPSGVTHTTIGDGEGVDIGRAVTSFTYSVKRTTVSASDKLLIAGMTNKVNSTTFKDFPAGTVRFVGASLSKTGKEEWRIVYRFEFQAAETVQMGGTAVTKGGWEYVWIRNRDSMGSDGQGGHTIIKEPTAYFIEQVFQTADLGTLPGFSSSPGPEPEEE